jgi:hypothetical protein
VMILFLYWMTERFARSRLAFGLLTAVLGAALLQGPFILTHVSSILRNGFAGSDNNQWKVMEYLAGKVSPGEDRLLGVEYWLVDSVTPADTLHPGNGYRDWFDYILLSRYGVHNAGAECRNLSTCETWEVVDQNAGIPDSVRGMTPEIVFGNYQVFRLR